MAYYRRRDLRGGYRPLNFVLPTNSLSGAYGPTLPAQVSPSAVAAMVRAMANAAQRGRSAYPSPRAYSGMSGGYYRRAGMGDVSSSLDDLKNWVTNNPALAGGIAIAGGLLLGMRGRRR